MKHINIFITEKLKIHVKKTKCTLFPKSNMELKRMVDDVIKNNGSTCSLNHIDVSDITDFNNIFAYKRFNGDISEWDVSNAKTMTQMFLYSDYTGENGDISDWDVSNVVNMDAMFMNTNYTGDISQWDVSNVKSMESMFEDSEFNKDISEWNVLNVIDMDYMFCGSKFNKDIYKWKINPNCKTHHMFYACNIKHHFVPKGIYI